MPQQSYTTLIQASDLMALMRDQSDVVVFDVSFDLTDTQAGERSHAQGHVPGAIYMHLERDLSGAKTGHNGRHPLPDRAAFAATAGRFGIRPGVQVVALDRQGGMYAGRRRCDEHRCGCRDCNFALPRAPFPDRHRERR
jgi:thiosulfate/3-mercaptopyruvate sulfurtransferase